MNNANQLEEINVTIDQAQKQIDEMMCLERLRKNADFKALIEDGYLKEEAARVVIAKADPNMQTEEHQKQLDNMIIGIGYLRQYLVKIYQFGNHAQRTIEAHKETRSEIMTEAQ